MSLFVEVVNCSIKADPINARLRGSIFGLFNDAASVDEVLRLKEHNLVGKSIDGLPQRARALKVRESLQRIFLGILSPGISRIFEAFGEIENIEHPRTQKPVEEDNSVYHMS